MYNRVGLLIENDIFFTTELCRGAHEACKELGIELIIFYGGNLGYNQFTKNSISDYQKTIAFSYSDVVNIDYLVVSTSGICQSNTDIKKPFLDHFHVPVVSLNSKIEGHSFVGFDNSQAVEKAVDFMIKHGRKNIGIISGNKNNTGSQERVQGYINSLNKNNIEIKEEHILYAPDYSRYNNSLIGKWLDQNPDIDGFMCATDYLAFSLYEELNKRGKSIGYDIDVCGFDDTQEASSIVPQLSSCHADSSYLAYTAVIEGYKQLSSRGIFEKRVATHFIPRMSVGYDIREDEEIPRFIEYCLNENYSLDYIAQGISNYIFENKLIYSKQIKQQVSELFVTMFHIVNNHEQLKNSYAYISRHIKNIFTYENTHYIDLDRILNAISVLMDIKGNNHKIIQNFYRFVYTQIINCYNGIITTKSLDYREDRMIINRINKDTMELEMTGLNYDVLAQDLQSLGIKNGKFYIYEQENVYYGDYKFDVPPYLILKSHLEDNRIMDDINMKVDCHELLEGMAKTTKIVSVVYSNQYQLGVLVSDISFYNFPKIEYISTQFGLSMRIMELVKSLNNTSMIDELTGLYNLRGLHYSFDNLKEHLGYDDCVYLILADMDRLKYINDHFGHLQGDHAIKRARDVLKNTFGKSSIICRTGGDEFVVVLKLKRLLDYSYLEERINLCTKEINDNYDYPFLVSLSYGIVGFDCTTEASLSDLIGRADQLMYTNKRKKHIQRES